QEQGMAVARFSLRPPSGLVDPADRAEAQQTTALVVAGPLRMLAALLGLVVTRPARVVYSVALAIRLGRRSERGVLRHLVYLAEACVLLRQLRRLGAEHLHAHFGTYAPAVALLARTLGGPPYSFTVHGPEEFDRPEAMAL